MEKFLTLTEVAKILGVEEKEVVKLAEEGEITAYRIGGNFLRFKLRDIDAYRKKISSPRNNSVTSQIKANDVSYTIPISDYSFRDRVYDFFYYHDFYIVVILIITLLLIIIFKF